MKGGEFFMKNPITAKRLALALSNKNMIPQELANASGVSKASISQYLNGSHAPSNISSGKMAKILDVNPVWLMGFDVPMKEKVSSLPQRKGVPIPVYGRVAAGVPLEMIEDIIDTEEITEEMAQTGDFFALQIHGDSMEPRMKEGDIVIVRRQDDAESGDTVIATVNGTDATCKRLRKYRDGIELIATNPSYEPMFFSNEEIEKKPVRILGRVVELRAKF